jgi:hypothetical protein
MRRLFAVGCVLMLTGAAPQPFSTAAAAQAPSAPQAEVPSFRSVSSELVVLPVVVKDRDGALVMDLPRERFTIFDNGRRLEPTFFSNEDTPVSVALVMDDSGSMREKLGVAIAGMLTLAKRSHPNSTSTFGIRCRAAASKPKTSPGSKRR